MLQSQSNSNLARLEREQKFHDQRFADSSLRDRQVSRFYQLTSSIKKQYQQALLEYSRDVKVIEYGCGTGSYACILACNGAAQVTGIDISPVAIAIAKESAKKDTIVQNLNFEVMNAEELKFEHSSIGLVCGSGILHHLELDKAMDSIVQVLKPNGQAIFIEPLGHNIFINLFRYLTPKIRSQDEHPLLEKDLDKFNQYFQQVEIKYFYLTAIAASIFVGMPGFQIILVILEELDKLLFRIPFFKKLAWQVLIQLSQPIKSDSSI